MFIRWLAEKNVGQPIRDDEGFLLGELHKEFLGSMGIYLFRRSALFELASEHVGLFYRGV